MYLWIKAIHVAAIVTFAGSLLAQGLYLAVAWSDATREMTQSFRRAERSITVPALLVALGSGVALATLGQWLLAPWLMLKLLLVGVLLAIHGVQSGQLRRLAEGRIPTMRSLRFMVLATVAAIAVLAVAKPHIG